MKLDRFLNCRSTAVLLDDDNSTPATKIKHLFECVRSYRVNMHFLDCKVNTDCPAVAPTCGKNEICVAIQSTAEREIDKHGATNAAYERYIGSHSGLTDAEIRKWNAYYKRTGDFTIGPNMTKFNRVIYTLLSQRGKTPTSGPRKALVALPHPPTS
jgi:hypothetical protein